MQPISNSFTVADGLTIQRAHMALHKKVLKASVYLALHKEVMKRNLELESVSPTDRRGGFKVLRGDGLQQVLNNLTLNL